MHTTFAVAVKPQVDSPHVADPQPTEIYNLGAQSHVKVSFEMAEYTGDVDGLGTLRILDAIRTAGLENHVRFYQVRRSFLSLKPVASC